jgi:hypothetical protein
MMRRSGRWSRGGNDLGPLWIREELLTEGRPIHVPATKLVQSLSCPRNSCHFMQDNQ